VDDDVAGHDLERYQHGLKDEEVPTCSHSEGIVDVAAGKSDEGRGDWQVRDHLSHA
jgi:hypothetical protein